MLKVSFFGRSEIRQGKAMQQGLGKTGKRALGTNGHACLTREARFLIRWGHAGSIPEPVKWLPVVAQELGDVRNLFRRLRLVASAKAPPRWRISRWRRLAEARATFSIRIRSE